MFQCVGMMKMQVTGYKWNNEQMYYLKPTSNVLQYEVYTDSAYTQAVDWTVDYYQPVNNAPSYEGLPGNLQLSIHGTGGEPGLILDERFNIQDGDELRIGNKPNTGPNLSQTWINDSTGVLPNSTYYLKYESTHNDRKHYSLWKDSGLTNQLTLSDFTMGSYSVDIPIINSDSISPYEKSNT